MPRLNEVVPESTIRRLTIECQKLNAVNLAQAFPDYDTKEEIKKLAVEAVKKGYNQYSHTWGMPILREAIAEKYQKHYGVKLDPEKNILVTCGCMEALRIALNIIIRNFGIDTEILILEPYYESFPIQTLLEGGIPKFFPLSELDFSLDVERLESVISPKTKALIINSPANPSGKMFSVDEMKHIYEICSKKDIFIISDETYEFITYGKPHITALSLGDLSSDGENIILAVGIGKTYAITGWRIGYLVASENVIRAIRASHDYNTVCAPSPLQYAAASLLKFPDSYYQELRDIYEKRKAFILPVLEEVGFECFDPEGAYYILADFSKIGERIGILDDVDFALFLIREIGVGAVPGTAFYNDKRLGRTKIRFTYSKKMETLIEARDRLLRLKNF